jgi:hypothetical protein
MHLAACAVVCLAVGVLARTVLKTRPSAARRGRDGGERKLVANGQQTLIRVDRPGQ